MARRRKGVTTRSAVSKSAQTNLNQYTASTLQLGLLSVVGPLAVNGGAQRVVPSLSQSLPFQLGAEAATGMLISILVKNGFMPPHSHTVLWGTLAAMAITTAQYLNTGNQITVPFTGVNL